MPLFPIPDPDVGSDDDPDTDPDPGFSHEYLNLLDDLGIPDIERLVGSNNETVQLIKSFVERAFKENSSLTVFDHETIAALLSRAQGFAKEARDSNSTDEHIRNAERYLYGLSAGVNKDIVNIGAISGAHLYESLKLLAFAGKYTLSRSLERLMRSDKNPLSAPSVTATLWANKGLDSADWYSIRRSFEANPNHSADRFKSQKSGLRDVRDLQFRKRNF